MERISGFISTYKSKVIQSVLKKERILNKQQSLAEEIWLHFNKKITFPMLMGLIKKRGDQAIRELFYESIKSDHADPLSLFLWKVGKNKIVWKNLNS